VNGYIWTIKQLINIMCCFGNETPIAITIHKADFALKELWFNDSWNIRGLSTQLNAKIYIFDRYGKLRNQISSNEQRRDVAYIKLQLPLDNNWFAFDFIGPSDGKPKQFRAHFSLKR